MSHNTATCHVKCRHSNTCHTTLQQVMSNVDTVTQACHTTRSRQMQTQSHRLWSRNTATGHTKGPQSHAVMKHCHTSHPAHTLVTQYCHRSHQQYTVTHICCTTLPHTTTSIHSHTCLLPNTATADVVTLDYCSKADVIPQDYFQK